MPTSEKLRILVVGATGAIGKPLLPLLTGAGYCVWGTTRSFEKSAQIAASGATPVVLDVYDRAALVARMGEIRPDVVIHQLTDLPPGLKPELMAEALHRNARVRVEGTRNIVDAMLAAGVKRLVAQSVSFVYAPGREPHVEDDPLDIGSDGDRRVTVKGVAALETATLNSPPIEGIVLRYGGLYGPGTGFEARRGQCPLYVDDAAAATVLAIEKGRPGAYNIAEANAYVSTEKALRELGFKARA